jgi:flagellar M-ring protein FliF
MASEEVVFSPPVAGELQGMHRSAVDSWEAARQDGLAIGIPGTDSNELGTGGVAEYPFGTLEDGELYERRISERNYELNQLVTTISHAQGRVESVSIAVLVNANAIDGDFSEEVSELVTFGFGIPASNVTVQSVPFSYIDTTFEAMFADMEAVRQQERTRELIALIIQWAVILLLGILVILLIRTIFKTLNPPAEPEPIMVSGSMGIDYIADDDDDISMIESIEYEEVDLQTKLPGLEQIERFIDKDPAAVAQLLRNWLSDE